MIENNEAKKKIFSNGIGSFLCAIGSKRPNVIINIKNPIGKKVWKNETFFINII